jgi:hypothetical protein
MAQKEIKLLKNNEDRDWADLEWINEFYQFLQGELPEGIGMKHHKPRLTQKQAFNIIWFLQEKFPILPDQIEQCDTCGELYESYSQGHHSELTGKNYCCESCEPPRLYEREQRWEKRKDAPFQKWLKKTKKEQKNYPFLKDKEISEHALRRYFNDGKTPIEALNDIITIV